ncbi:2,3-dimethylmalate lyase [Shewanella denitrificans OS217]|jgi:phosphoenolpyruvate phosphomutase|uniref:phosphoenolpyruvate mutase n=1 Tax=Shewanella denitrificans (strain OS217 / ATCC BAA-1090 / DSM 15013) TaxID=318161 RepID=Q12Q29_SHEDO|nr:phosphoenolpyruvate mutase [Shewanella denitrificans]ABE54447.1 2,3-dimethylmalate lyase [Shewanella denitrificans OS217]
MKGLYKHQNKKRTLKDILLSPTTEYLMEAHNAISAKIIEEVGFSGIWASGLTISSSLGVRDRNEISWTQVIDAVEYMTDVVDCPILLDVDTGYGDYNSFRRVVKKLCQRNISGCCIEDKIFPKQNSFIGERQELASIAEFTGKIKAGIDHRENEDFVIIARTEALISGYGIDEALRRAEAYYEAGADAILIHSKSSNADEVLEFCNLFTAPCPIVIVPTKYYNTPTNVFEEAGVSTVIWANHSLRASVKAIRETAEIVFKEKSLVSVENKVASLAEIFRLNGEHEMEQIEKRYLQEADSSNIIFLAASRGQYLKTLTEDRPKCLIEINGKPLLQHAINRFRSVGVNDISVVSGYKGEQINHYDVKNIANSEYEATGECYSLYCALSQIKKSTIVAYGDLILDGYIINQLPKNDSDADIVIYVDKSNEQIDNHDGCFVQCSSSYSPNPFENEGVSVLAIVDASDRLNAHGQWIGVMKIMDKGVARVHEALQQLIDAGEVSASISDLLGQLLKTGSRVKCEYVNGGWIDINTAMDLEFAKRAEAKAV